MESLYLDVEGEYSLTPITTRLARVVERYANSPGDHLTPLAALSLHRRDVPTEPVHCIYDFGLSLTLQGRKQVMLNETIVSCGPGESMLTPLEVPVISHITHATRQQPYLGLLLRLDTRFIALAVSEMKLPHANEELIPATPSPLSTGTLDLSLLETLYRLVESLEEPSLLPHVASLIQQEITFRLLLSCHGSYLRQLVITESPRQQITRIIVWMKQNFTQTVPINDLAAKANMSPSTFRQHFRESTGMSPLQFQKQLRLLEARQLMLNQNLDVGQAARIVGYESASQFSREYSRLLGASPQIDIRRMRSN